MQTQVLRFSIVCCLSLLTGACVKVTVPPQKFGGAWTMSLGQRTFMVLQLTESGGKVTGTLSRPESFQVDSSGFRFSHITSVEAKEAITSATIQNDQLRFVTANPKDKEDTSEYEMTLTSKDQASLKITDAPLDAWNLTRSSGNSVASVAKDWDPQRSYTVEDSAVSNTEMQRIYDEDQKPRQKPGELSAEKWTVLNEQDAERRRLTRQLLADGKLRTGEDFARAAFIFQHGSSPDDFLLAHTLATIAVAKGDEEAIWITTATLDRYLHSAGKPQIYGTQFKAGSSATQEPFNRDLISDALRRQLGVPSLSAQQEQQKYWAEQFKSAATKP